MFIELLGLPGSGKTYFSDSLIKKLDQAGKKGLNITELTRSSFGYKVCARLVRMAAESGAGMKQLRNELKSITGKYDVPAAYNTCRIDYYCNDIVLQIFLKRIFDRKSSVCILDEGIYQKLVNMYVNYGVSDEDLIRLAETVKKYTDTTYFLGLTADEAFESVKKRNRHVCALDELGDDDLREFLGRYSAACCLLADRYGLKKIGRTDVDAVCSGLI